MTDLDSMHAAERHYDPTPASHAIGFRVGQRRGNPIPTVSERGLIAMVVVIGAAAAFLFGKRRRQAAA